LQPVVKQYPGNVIYALSAAFQAEAAGQQTAAIEYARQATEAAKRSDASCASRLLEAAQGALDRLQTRAK
jgi:hypothetical protein